MIGGRMNFHPHFPDIPLPVFSGEPNESVLNFIENFEKYADIHSYNDTFRFKVFRWCLRGEALQAFNFNKMQYSSCKEWKGMREKFIQDFDKNTVGGYFSAFVRRKQLPTERALSYVRDKLELLRFSKIEIPEKEQVQLLTEGLLPDMRGIVQIMKPKTLSDFEADVRIATNSSLSFTQSDKNFQVLSTDSYPTSNCETEVFHKSEFQDRGQYAHGNSTNNFNRNNIECRSLESLANWQDINLKLDLLLKMRLGESEENVEFISHLKTSNVEISQDSSFPAEELEFQSFSNDSNNHIKSVLYPKEVVPDVSSIFLTQPVCDSMQNEISSFKNCLTLGKNSSEVKTGSKEQVFLVQNDDPENEEFEKWVRNRNRLNETQSEIIKEVKITQKVEGPQISENFEVETANEVGYLNDCMHDGVTDKNEKSVDIYCTFINVCDENFLSSNLKNGQESETVSQNSAVGNLSGSEYSGQEMAITDQVGKRVKNTGKKYSTKADENYFEKGNNFVQEEIGFLGNKNVSSEEFSHKQKTNYNLSKVNFLNNKLSLISTVRQPSSDFSVLHRGSLPSFENNFYKNAFFINEISKPAVPKLSPSWENGSSYLQKKENRNWKVRKKSFSSGVAVDYFFKHDQGVFPPAAA